MGQFQLETPEGFELMVLNCFHNTLLKFPQGEGKPIKWCWNTITCTTCWIKLGFSKMHVIFVTEWKLKDWKTRRIIIEYLYTTTPWKTCQLIIKMPQVSNLKYLLVAICDTTNFVFAIPLKRREKGYLQSSHTSNYMHFGSTQTVHSRQGYGFKAKVMQHILNAIKYTFIFYPLLVTYLKTKLILIHTVLKQIINPQ